MLLRYSGFINVSIIVNAMQDMINCQLSLINNLRIELDINISFDIIFI